MSRLKLLVLTGIMSSNPPRPSIQELNLENADEISLYLELIRLIEKDIDDLKANDTRSGWTSWAIVGGIAAALSVFFGETRKLQTFPMHDVEVIVIAGLFLYNACIVCLKLLYPAGIVVRPGRIRWSNDEYFSFLPSGIYALLVILGSIVAVALLPLRIAIKLLAIGASLLWAFWTGVMLVSSQIKQPLGNNRLTRKSARVIGLITFVSSIVASTLLFSQATAPVGETATLPYVLAGLILALILLTGNLIYRAAPSRLLSNLEGLKNDIVFLRVDIDEALRRYETLKEGESLPDALQKDLSEIVNDLNAIEYAHSNMRTLIQRLVVQLSINVDTPESKEQKAKQFNVDIESYRLHEAKCNELLRALGTKLNSLSKKQVQLASVTEDWTSENAIRSLLAERLKRIEDANAQLNENIQRVVFYWNNPDKIPVDLRAATNIQPSAKQEKE